MDELKQAIQSMIQCRKEIAKLQRNAKEKSIQDALREEVIRIDYSTEKLEMQRKLLNSVWQGVLKDVTKIVVEPDTEDPVPIAVIDKDDINTQMGYRVCLTPNYDD